jgi:hypothetical protein
MLTLTPAQITDYLRKSYAAADGLWFMKVEDACGFDAALDIDEKVWRVMPKIQARAMKSFCGGSTGLDALVQCFETKLQLDGFEFSTTTSVNSAEIPISKCPWYDKLVKSHREHLADKIGSRICLAEFSGWAAEFGCKFSFTGDDRICRGCRECGVRFTATRA